MDNTALLINIASSNLRNSTNGSSIDGSTGSYNDDDCQTCGLIAAFIGVLAWGTFGVPIKSNAAQRVNIDPLVFQTYKTTMCFLTSWLILLYGESFSFTPWGFVSGLFWVPGGIATVYGVKNAGLALGIGTVASCIVLVSFIWGILVFKEHLHNIYVACIGIIFLISGLIGMAYFASPQSSSVSASSYSPPPRLTAPNSPKQLARAQVNTLNGDDSDYEEPLLSSIADKSNNSSSLTTHTSTTNIASDNIDPTHNTNDDNGDYDYSLLQENNNNNYHRDSNNNTIINDENNNGEDNTILIFQKYRIKRRHTGILSSIFSGLYGGSILAPMKLSNDPKTEGTHFLMSFAIGAMTVNIIIWIMRYLFNVIIICRENNNDSASGNNESGDDYVHSNPFVEAYYALPSFHIFNGMLLPGTLSGLLWSIGNFCSLISVEYLGEGVGYSVVQSYILLSGLWGIFYFREVTEWNIIIKWFLSAFVTLTGILIVSYEHHEK